MDKLRYVVGDQIVYSECEPITSGIIRSRRGPVAIKITITDGTQDKFDAFIASDLEYKYATLVKKKVVSDQSGYLNVKGINFSREKVEGEFKEDEETPLGKIIPGEYLVDVVSPMGDTEIAAIKYEDIMGI